MDKNKFRAALALKGYSYEDIAKKIGVHVTSISNKVNGKTEFNREEIKKIVNILELNPEELMWVFFE